MTDTELRPPVIPAPIDAAQAARTWRRARGAASLRAAMLAVVLAVVSVVLSVLGWLVLPLVPLPFAFVALRFGRRPVAVATLAFALAGAALGTAYGVGAAVSLAILVGGLVGGLALALASVGIGRRFQAHPYAWIAGCYVVLLAASGFAFVAGHGLAGTRNDLGSAFGRSARAQYREIERVMPNAIDDCERADERSAVSCVAIRRLQNPPEHTVARYAFPILAGALVTFALFAAAWSLLWLRRLGAPRGVAVQTPRAFAVFETHWSIAYVTAAGVVLWLAARHLHGPWGSPLRTLAVAFGIGGALLVLLQGMSVVSWWFRVRGLRRWLVVVFWVLCAVSLLSGSTSLWLTLGFFAFVSMTETMFQLRRRVAQQVRDRDHED